MVSAKASRNHVTSVARLALVPHVITSAGPAAFDSSSHSRIKYRRFFFSTVNMN